MAKQHQDDGYPLGTYKQNLIPPTNQNLSTNSKTMIVEPEPNAAITSDQTPHTETIWRIVVDAISLAILTTVTVISHYVAIPFTRGFFCSDMTIKYPYKPDTIPAYAAVLLSIGLPIIVMWTTEFAKRFYYTHYQRQPFMTRLELCGEKITNIKPFYRNLYILTVVFAYGYLATWVLLEVTKNFIGELRPHFLAVCQPSFNCSSVTVLNVYNSYLQHGIDYTCLNTDDALVREARRSFFSGHTAPVFFGFGFLIMYIHVSWSWRHLGIVGHLLQIGIAILGLYIGYTRISDFHHHWHDVLTGGIVGSLIAFVTFKFILNWRRYSPRFLPHTISITHPKSAAISNGGANISNHRRVNPANNPEDLHYF